MIQEKLIFYPEKIPSNFKFSFKNCIEENFQFEGKKLNSLLFTDPDAEAVLLYFHGNAGSLNSWGFVANEIRRQLKQNVWIIDYPGYGKSEGRIYSEKQLLDLALKFFEIANRKFPKLRIVSYGRSIGSGPAAWLAQQKQLPLILETPYSSFSKLVSELAPWFPKFLHRYSFDVLNWLKKFEKPLLLIHGENDEIICSSHSEIIAERVPHSTHVQITGAFHNNISDFPQYWKELRNFTKQLVERL